MYASIDDSCIKTPSQNANVHVIVVKTEVSKLGPIKKRKKKNNNNYNANGNTLRNARSKVTS